MQVISPPTICRVCEAVTLTNGMLYCTECADECDMWRILDNLCIQTGNAPKHAAIVRDEPSSMDDIYTALYLYDYCENMKDKMYILLGFPMHFTAYNSLPLPYVASDAYEVLKENTLFAQFTPNSQGTTIDYSYYQLKFHAYMPFEGCRND